MVADEIGRWCHRAIFQSIFASVFWGVVHGKILRIEGGLSVRKTVVGNIVSACPARSQYLSTDIDKLGAEGKRLTAPVHIRFIYQRLLAQ